MTASRYHTLEDGVPLPSIAREDKRQYPFETMQVGQSFLVPHEQGRSVGVLAAQFLQTHKGWRFSTRVVNEGVRVWRLAPKERTGE